MTTLDTIDEMVEQPSGHQAQETTLIASPRPRQRSQSEYDGGAAVETVVSRSRAALPLIACGSAARASPIHLAS